MRLPLPIVHPPQHYVLHKHLLAGAGLVGGDGGHEALQRVGRSRRHQGPPQRLVGRVQAQRQADPRQVVRQLQDAGDDADGGHGHGCAPQSEPGVIGHHRHGGAHRLVVVHGLPHAHEHHVANGRQLAGMHQLLHNLAGSELAFDAHGAGGTEGASHGTPHLRRHTKGGARSPRAAAALRVASATGNHTRIRGVIVHDDGLHCQPILQPQQHLGRFSIAAVLRVHHGGGGASEPPVQGSCCSLGEVWNGSPLHLRVRRQSLVQGVDVQLLDASLSECGGYCGLIIHALRCENTLLSCHCNHPPPTPTDGCRTAALSE
mmetsp:Transcript_10124/g.30308  ORF Transcript_10124/g.30308 Transcript_10124/m.30308 type:complete len:317 (-) Transcript_10124:577-1527(-)